MHPSGCKPWANRDRCSAPQRNHAKRHRVAQSFRATERQNDFSLTQIPVRRDWQRVELVFQVIDFEQREIDLTADTRDSSRQDVRFRRQQRPQCPVRISHGEHHLNNLSPRNHVRICNNVAVRIDYETRSNRPLPPYDDPRVPPLRFFEWAVSVTRICTTLGDTLRINASTDSLSLRSVLSSGRFCALAGGAQGMEVAKPRPAIAIAIRRRASIAYRKSCGAGIGDFSSADDCMCSYGGAQLDYHREKRDTAFTRFAGSGWALGRSTGARAAVSGARSCTPRLPRRRPHHIG